MARIRTVKPEFWTDSVVVQLPYEARLLFIGIWNFCDDQGYLVNEPDRLRMQVFPSEPSLDLASLLDLLVASERLEMFTAADGESLLRVKNFEKHQRVDNASKPRFAGAKKRAIPNQVRRAVAAKYGCEPGCEKEAACFYCGALGNIHWWKTSSGKASSWVSFSLELDHVEAEAAGGEGEAKNIVLACRACNRSKGSKEFAEMWPSLAKPRESSPAEGKGSRKGMEGNGSGKGMEILAPQENAAPPEEEAPTAAVWNAYSRAYERRYRVKPTRDAAVNSQLLTLVKRLGAEAPAVAEFYVSHNKAYYLEKCHAVGPLVADYHGLRSQWARGVQVTSTKARQEERTQENVGGWMELSKGPKHGVV